MGFTVLLKCFSIDGVHPDVRGDCRGINQHVS